MLADLIRGFCNEPENNYEVYENYVKSTTTMFGEMTITTIGIVVKQDQNIFDVLAQLTSYLATKEFDDQLLGQLVDELEGTSIDELGPDRIMYFPYIQDYHPLQP